MPLFIQPPLVNAASPWASTKDDLQKLYESPYTGAVTTRTCLLGGYHHDDAIHQHTFFDARSGLTHHARSPNANSSLNTLGYSPVPLDEYLSYITDIVIANKRLPRKRFIVSVTGTSEDVVDCCRRVQRHASAIGHPLMVEVNLACPNIPNRPPPAYEKEGLLEYLNALQKSFSSNDMQIGIKLPPYTYAGQYQDLVSALLATTTDSKSCPIVFITSTNTLGSCLVMTESENSSSPDMVPALRSETGTGIGGLAGAAIHPLSLGNVANIRQFLDQHASLRHIEIIGVGGVGNFGACERMMAAGASCVGIASAHGRLGVAIFEEIASEQRNVRVLLAKQNHSLS